MNKRNDWENLLRTTNEDLEKTGYTIKITDYYNDGCYTCEFIKDGVSVMVYAENYYEDELTDLITDAFHYVNDILKKEEKGAGIAVKRTSITPEDIKRTKQVLIDNGIEENEADIVLQAIGYTLIDTELYPYPECEDYMS